MVLLNQATRELTAKVVYYGPGLCGKTSNLQFIYETLDEAQRGKMLSLATDTDRTLFFDFMPMDLGSVKGFRVRVQLYTVPGQVFYAETRKRVLKGADGVVFVADSQESMVLANQESLRELAQHLRENGLDPETIPTVLQYNKRDLKNIRTVEEMDSDLNPNNLPFFEAIAKEGVGVEDTLKCVSKLVLKKLMGQAQESVSPRSVPAPKPKPKAVPPPVESVVMDNRKLLSELGVAPAPPPPVPPPPPPAPLPAAEEEVLLGAVGDNDASLFEATGNPLALEDSGEDLLAVAEELPLSAVEAEEAVSPDPDGGLGGLDPDVPEEEAALLADPPPLQADIPPDERTANEDEAPGTDLAVGVGKPLGIELLVGGKRFRLSIRIEEV